MNILKKIMMCMLVLTCLPFSACSDETSSSSSQQYNMSYDESLPLFELLSNETYTYQGVEYATYAYLYEGEKYFCVPAYTAWGSYCISGEFDQRIGRTSGYNYLYSMSEDTTQSILYGVYYRDFSIAEGGWIDLLMNERAWLIREGVEFPNVFQAALTHVHVFKETLVEKKMQVETLLDVDFPVSLCLGDILSEEDPVTEIDTRLDVYATFDLADYTWLQLGELALYEKSGEIYIRTDAWEEKYYRLKDEYQALYKDALIG